ncbi:MAG: AI-2E family transporter [Collinsella sp.]
MRRHLGTLIFTAFSAVPLCRYAGSSASSRRSSPSCRTWALSRRAPSARSSPCSPRSGQAIICVIVYLAVQFVENQFIYPHVVGSSVGLSALWDPHRRARGRRSLGIVGIVFFIPIVAVLYELVRQVDQHPPPAEAHGRG